jgi:hypothetical protein
MEHCALYLHPVTPHRPPGFLAAIPATCNANLPRVWEAVEGTTVSTPSVNQGRPRLQGGPGHVDCMQDCTLTTLADVVDHQKQWTGPSLALVYVLPLC